MKIALLLLGLVGGIAVVGGLPGSGSAPFESAASGPQVTYWSNGTKKSATEYRNGGRTARSEQWHSNGQRASRGQTENGLREGAWEFWGPDGRPDPVRTGTYSLGKRVSD